MITAGVAVHLHSGLNHTPAEVQVSLSTSSGEACADWWILVQSFKAYYCRSCCTLVQWPLWYTCKGAGVTEYIFLRNLLWLMDYLVQSYTAYHCRSCCTLVQWPLWYTCKGAGVTEYIFLRNLLWLMDYLVQSYTAYHCRSCCTLVQWPLWYTCKGAGVTKYILHLVQSYTAY